MTFGLSDQGFTWMTGSDVLTEIGAGAAGRPSMAGLRRDGEGRFANFAGPFSEQAGRVWEALAALYFSMDPSTASGESLVARGAEVLKTKLMETRSTVPLTLYNRSSSSPVEVLALNQVMQSATGTLWETLVDTTIPALTTLHENLNVSTQTWQNTTTVRIAFGDSPDLSAVAIGDEITVSGSTNASNNGTFPISAINVASFWVEVPNPARTDADDDESSSPATADIEDVETSIEVAGQAVEYGPLEASEGTIDTIQTPVSGWDAVSNLEAAQVGRNTQSDTEFRRDILNSPTVAKGGLPAAIVKRIKEDVAGVTYATCEQNDTDEVVDGMAKHSIRVTVVGGEHQAIIDTLGDAKGAGIGTNGDQVGVWTDEQGRTHPVKYLRVTKRVPYLHIEITKDAGFPAYTTPAEQAAVHKTISDALVAIEYGHGDNLINHELGAAISDLKLPGTETIVVKQSWSASPTLTVNLAVDADEQVDLDANRFTFSITNA